MGRTYQGQDLALGLHIKATKPIDDREVIATAADRLIPDTWLDADGNYYVYPGMETRCADTGQIFVYTGRANNSADIENPLKWTTCAGGGGGSIDPSQLTAVEQRANAYTDKKVQELADTMGSTKTLSMAEYLALKDAGSLQNTFYAIYKNDELYRMYFGTTLFAKKAESGEHVTIGAAFPLVFPIIFA